MKYEVKHIKNECCFEIYQDERFALVKYQMLDKGLMKIYHIEMLNITDTQMIENILMKEVLEYARKNHCRLLPACPSVRDYLWSHPRCQDMLV